MSYCEVVNDKELRNGFLIYEQPAVYSNVLRGRHAAMDTVVSAGKKKLVLLFIHRAIPRSDIVHAIKL